MIDFCYAIIQKHWKGSERLLVYRAVKLFLLLFYPLYVRLTRPKGVDPTSKVIVSLTSFPARIGNVYLTVESLLRQKVRPQRVVLWLSEEQFKGISVPASLRKLEKYGLDIEFCEDLRSHKKYYGSMRKYPENTIITADDDTLYPESWTADLIRTSEQYPNSVVCARALQIRCDAAGRPLPYTQWIDPAEGVTSPRMDLMPLGCEGVLYPPHVLCDDVFDKAFFMTACRNADDLWLKAMSLLKDVPVMPATPEPYTYVNLMTAKVCALYSTNVGENQNDQQLNNILERYPGLLRNICSEGH